MSPASADFGAAPEPAAVPPPARRSRLALATGGVLLIVALAAAISIDVVKAGFGIKSDEATYVSMALSLAYDHDLTYERRDLERFYALYRQGPEGVFLKRGKVLHVRPLRSPPFIAVSRMPDPRADRLYFGKALIYPVAVAPFVAVAGMNGFLIFHALLLFAVGVCGYLFLAARSRPGPALLFTLAFIFATAVPVQAVFLMPDTFNLAVVFFAYFLWLYKEVAPPERLRFLRGPGTDVAAAILLGLATYSKPTNVFLIMPLVALHWWRGRRRFAATMATVFAVTTIGLFAVNALNSGEFNYQGGDRKTFYGQFPFDTRDAASSWELRGLPNTTNETDAENVLAPSEFINRFGLNVEYFLIGRHFGFVPYFFPGVVALLLWMFSRERFEAWRVLTFMGFAVTTAGLLLILPYSWSGGGGPPGNRYFMSVYPVVFFLTPPLASAAPAMLAWLVGALFTARMVVNPFVAAKFPWQTTERGAARRLPVEMTMANDLPVMLAQPLRGHIPYGRNPTVLLYFLDENAYPPEPEATWVAASGRADIIVRSEQPLDHLAVTVTSPIRTVFTVSAGGSRIDVPLVPGKPASFNLPTYGVRGNLSYEYLLSARSSEGFIPRLVDPKSTDTRNLGAQMRFTAVERH